MALLCAAAWLVAELNGPAHYTRLSHAVFNTFTRLMVLLLTAFMLSAFKDLSSRLVELVDQRTRALRDLSIRLSQAEESERSRIAHDVHDGLGQVLTLLKLNLGNAIAEYSKASLPTQRLEELVALVSSLIDHSRTLTFDLHPTMLETLGLLPTLRQYAEQFSRQTQVEVTISEAGKCGQPPAVLSGYIFRATKELMTNAVKHGHASQIVVSVFWKNKSVRVMVDDDGAGFDPASVAPGVGKTGIGLAGIRERIQALQGALTIESVLGGGTRGAAGFTL